MALLDAYGRPLQMRTLTEPQATGGMTGVRQVWTDSVASGLTPQRLAGILRACDQGDLRDYLTLAQEMEERDPHYASVLGIRKRAISGIEPRVIPGTDDARGKEIAQAVREDIADDYGFPGLVEDVLDSLGPGFSLIEIIWSADKSGWWPECYERVDPRWVTFDRETGRDMRLLDDRDPVCGIELSPGHFIQHQSRLKSGLPFRNGLARLVSFSWMCKSYTQKDWMAFIETYGLPLRVGLYGPEATKQDIQVLFRAVANIGTDAAAVLPKNMDIDFVNAVTAASGAQIFEVAARWTDEQISKAVLGQTMTSDNGSSEAQAKVHNEVRHDIAQADARSVSAAINRDLVRTYVDVNFGAQERYPRIVIDVTEPEDTKAVVDSITSLAKAGVRFRASEARAKVGMSDPEDGDEIFGGIPVATAPTARNRQLVALNRAGGDPEDDIDEIAREMNGDWERVMEPMLAPIEDLVARSGSYEDLLNGLAAVYPEMSVAELVDALVKGDFKARALGDAAQNG